MLSAILAPITPDNPMGDDINYDPDFEAVKMEIGKLGGIDFALIRDKCVPLIRDKSKDIRVFSFLSFACLKNDEWQPFAEVFEGLVQLAEKDFHNLFPLRQRAKEMALQWLSEPKFLDLFTSKKPPLHTHEHITLFIGALNRFKELIEKQLPESSCFPAPLLQTALQWDALLKKESMQTKEAPVIRDTAPKQQPATQPDAAIQRQEPPPEKTIEIPHREQVQPPMQDLPATSESATPPVRDAGSVQGAVPLSYTNPSGAYDAVREMALYLIEQQPEIPAGYRLLRCSRWDKLDKAPAVEGGALKIFPPPPERALHLQNLASKNEWKKVLLTAEKTFSSGTALYWLDLHRISADACLKLGDTFKAVHDAICLETALFIKRIPAAPTFLYADNSPCCNELTKQWIRDAIVPFVSHSASNSVNTMQDEGDDAWLKEREEIRGIAAKNTTEAVAQVQRLMAQSGNERLNFKRSLLLGSLLLANKRPDVACALLEQLSAKVSRYNLDTWEPALALETWSQLYSAYKQLNSVKPIPTTVLEKQNSILNKICCLDPHFALQMSV